MTDLAATIDNVLLPWADPEFRANPFPWYDRLRREAPVYRDPLNERTYIVSRYEDIAEFGKHPSLTMKAPSWVIRDKAAWGWFEDCIIVKDPPEQGALLKARRWLYSCRDMLFPIFSVLMLTIAVQVAEGTVGSSWLVRIAQSIAVIGVLYAAINRFVRHPLINAAARWIGIPIATLQVFGVLDNVSL